MTDWPTLLRETRDRLGLSQVQLAEALGVTRQTVENWEGGHTKPALPEITRRALEMLPSGPTTGTR